jgi:hypothetical protein
MGTLTDLVEQGANGGLWACPCPACAAAAQHGDAAASGTASGGAGGATPGDFARAPTDNAFAYVAQASAQGSGDQVASLMAGSKWSSVDAASGRTVVTYSFADPSTSVFSGTDAAAFAKTLKAFSQADRDMTRQLLDKIAAVCNVQFVEVPDNAAQCGAIRYAYSDQPTTMNFAGYAFYPSSTTAGGNVWIASAQAAAQWDFYRPDLVLHETLHAMGLKHPFSGGTVLASEQDIIPNTVMSYSPVSGGTSGSLSSYPAEPMAFDIAALQYLYGASKLAPGDDVYDLASSYYQSGFHTVWDASGRDTLDASGIGHGVQLDLRAGGHSDIGAAVTAQAYKADGSAVATTYHATFGIASGAQIENAVGTAFADSLNGNELANRIVGGGGNDMIDGGDGVDTAAYAGARAQFRIAHNGNATTVQDTRGGEGSDTLANVERVKFADGAIALDIDGHAGTVAKVIGAVFGGGAVADAGLVAVGLSVEDSGNFSLEQLSQLAVNARLGAGASNAAVVDLLFTNLVGHAPSAAEAAPFVQMLEHGTSVGALAAMAAEHPLNLGHIDLVGLSANGLAYAG